MRLRASSLHWRWGIGAHLGVAFTAVVALAIAANLLIEHEISVIRTTRIVRVQASPVFAASAAVMLRTAPTSASTPPQIQAAVSAKSLVAALEHFVDAVRNRLDIHNDERDSELTTAGRELEREMDLYASASIPGTSDAREKLPPRFAEFRARGNDLVRAADARRSVLQEFWDRFDALDARTKAALARSWKIFGRVVARKTLVDLNSSLDEIRREFAGPRESNAASNWLCSRSSRPSTFRDFCSRVLCRRIRFYHSSRCCLITSHRFFSPLQASL